VDWEDAPAVEAIFARLRRLARERRAVALKLDPGVPLGRPAGDRALAALGRQGFRRLDAGPGFEGVQPRFVMRLSLAGRGLDEILAAMAPKTRYNVRLSERRGVRVRSGGRDDLPAFYRLLVETARRDRFVVRTFDYFARLWETCVEPGLARLWLGERDGELLAGAVAFLVGSAAWYLYGASASRQRDAMASHAVQWRMIRWAHESGCAVYDFRGVSGDLRPDNPLHGLYRFKKGFGGELVEWVGEWDRPCRPLPYWMARRVLPVARRVLAMRRAASESEA
jgi:peptidoglycan pentaglycine glycine transferase (the first glycine)